MSRALEEALSSIAKLRGDPSLDVEEWQLLRAVVSAGRARMSAPEPLRSPARVCLDRPMCNNYANDIAYDAYREAFAELKIPVRFPDAAPNLEPRDSIKPTDFAPVIRATDDGLEWTQLSWGFPPARAKGPPVINFRSEKRRFPHGRCLIPASAVYEYTGTKYPKTKWAFRKVDEPWLCVAGIWRPVGDAAAFTMLTCDPGPDVALYHNRQVVILDRADWAEWLDLRQPAEHLLRPSPAKTLMAEKASRGAEEREPELAV